MRFRTKESRKKSCYGKSFVKKRFLFFPLEINGEVRWLETVKIKYQISYSHNEDTYFWTERKFID